MNKNILLLTPQRSGSHYIKSVLQTSPNVVVTAEKQADHVIAEHIGLSRLPTHEDHQVFTLMRNLNIVRNTSFFDLNKAKNKLQKTFESESNYSADNSLLLIHMPTGIAYYDILNFSMNFDHIIYSVRNPYAVVASIKKVRPNVKLEEAAIHAGNLLTIFVKLGHKSVIKFTYEQMCQNPIEIQNMLVSNIPELDINIEKPVSTLSPCTTEDNTQPRKTENYNKKTISTLDHSSKQTITDILKLNFSSEMNQLGYEFL